MKNHVIPHKIYYLVVKDTASKGSFDWSSGLDSLDGQGQPLDKGTSRRLLTR
jgi:hypothetical protein